MIHRHARRLLSALIDGELPPGQEGAVRAHLDHCGRCRRALGEIEAAEALLRRLPAALIPLAWNPTSEGRLAGLARWAPEPAGRSGWRLPALGAIAAAALAAVLWIQPEATQPGAASAHETPSQLAVAARMPSSFLMPAMEVASVSYSWRQ